MMQVITTKKVFMVYVTLEKKQRKRNEKTDRAVDKENC